jgi:UbiD family decarboxylase
MAFNSFRDFLAQLEAAGELRRVAKPLATELEITELADREMKKPDGGKALLVEKPTGFPVSAGNQRAGIVSADGDEHGRRVGG